MSAKNAHVLADGLEKQGFKILNKNFFNEFVVEVYNSDVFLLNLEEAGILGGIKLSPKTVLVSTTELISQSDIELYLKSV